MLGKWTWIYNGNVINPLCINSNLCQYLQCILNYRNFPLSQIHIEPLPNPSQAAMPSRKPKSKQENKWLWKENLWLPMQLFLSIKGGKLRLGYTYTFICPFSQRCRIDFLPIIHVDIPQTLKSLGIYQPTSSISYWNSKLYCIQLKMPHI